MEEAHKEIFRQFNLHDTQQRRLVLQALSAIQKPASHKAVHDWIKQQDATINLATVYRTLQLFEDTGIVHRQPSSGGFILCSRCKEKGHHGFLSCNKCGKVEEFSDPKLCKEENRIAKESGFTPKHHISEIIGLCSSCHK